MTPYDTVSWGCRGVALGVLVAVLDDVMLGILIAGLSTRSLGLFRRGLHVADRAVTRFCGDFVIGVATGSVP